MRFVNGDTATVRSTHLERITLTEEEQREAFLSVSRVPHGPVRTHAAHDRPIHKSHRRLRDRNHENAFDEILKPDGTPLTEVELRTERGKPVVDEPLDEEKAKRKAQAGAKVDKQLEPRQLEVRYAGEHEPGIVIISCNVCRRRGASRHEWRVALDSNGVMDGTALHKIRSHCGQFASVRHASTLEHCVALGRLTGRVFSQRASDASRLPAKTVLQSGRARRAQASHYYTVAARQAFSAVETRLSRGGGGEERASTANPRRPEIC